MGQLSIHSWEFCIHAPENPSPISQNRPRSILSLARRIGLTGDTGSPVAAPVRGCSLHEGSSDHRDDGEEHDLLIKSLRTADGQAKFRSEQRQREADAIHILSWQSRSVPVLTAEMDDGTKLTPYKDILDVLRMIRSELAKLDDER